MKIVDRSPALASLNYFKGQVLSRAGLRRHHSGSTAYHLNAPDEAVRYVRSVVEDYIQYGAGNNARILEGASILEIGPGDNLGVAFLLLAKGARSVTCIDGFRPLSSDSANSRLYRRLFDLMNEDEKERVNDVVRERPDGGVDLQPGRLHAFYGLAIEAVHGAFTSDKYDLIVSRAVLEHVGDLERAWSRMVSCLAPTGQMWHKVDFRSHNFFREIHSLHFLTIPEKTWHLISSPDPTLNRKRLPAYRELLDRTFAEYKIAYTRVLDDPEITPHVEHLIEGSHYRQVHIDAVHAIRPRLQQPYSEHCDEDLLVNGVFLAGRRKKQAVGYSGLNGKPCVF